MHKYNVALMSVLASEFSEIRTNLGAGVHLMPDIVDVSYRMILSAMKVPADPAIDLRKMVIDDLHPRLQADLTAKLTEMLDILDKRDKSIAIPARFERKLRRICGTIASIDPLIAEGQIRALLSDLFDELDEPMFLCIQPAQRPHYEQKEFPFGADVERIFPDSKRDVRAASRCLALDEWTACVFHLMRVLEHGLRAAAMRFEVPFTTDSWHKVIKGIEDGISELRNKPGQTDQDRIDITNYSEAAIQFRHFKDAWRNHVSHAREHYDQRDAETVWAAVKSFMQKMAEIV